MSHLVSIVAPSVAPSGLSMSKGLSCCVRFRARPFSGLRTSPRAPPTPTTSAQQNLQRPKYCSAGSVAASQLPPLRSARSFHTCPSMLPGIRDLLFPLDVSALPFWVFVCFCIHMALAARVAEAVLREAGFLAPPRAIRFVANKFMDLFCSIGGSRSPTAVAAVSEMVADALGSLAGECPCVALEYAGTVCPHCNGDLGGVPPSKMSKPTLLLAFTWAAGPRMAQVLEKQCVDCGRRLWPHWSFRVVQEADGRAVGAGQPTQSSGLAPAAPSDADECAPLAAGEPSSGGCARTNEPGRSRWAAGRPSRAELRYIGPVPLAQGGYFEVPTLSVHGGRAAGYVVHQRVLRLCTGILLDCHGSFWGVAKAYLRAHEMEDSDKFFQPLRGVLPTLWTFAGLISLLPQDKLRALDWPSIAYRSSTDAVSDLYKDVLADVRRAFQAAWLTGHVCTRCAIGILGLDGKVGCRRYTCAALATDTIESPELGLTLQTGCQQKPRPGGLFCAAHADAPPSSATAGGAAAAILSGRDAYPRAIQVGKKEDGTLARLRVEEAFTDRRYKQGFRVEAAWSLPEDVDAAVLRRFEEARQARVPKNLRRKGPAPIDCATAAGAYGAELDLTAVEEAAAGCTPKDVEYVRCRTAGIVAAVWPCLVCADFRELHTSESLPQVWFFLAALFGLLRGAGRQFIGIFYDNGCGLYMYMTSLRRLLTALARQLAQIRVVVDRLHYRGHTGCKPGGSNPIPRVDPSSWPELQEVNTQACEQFFAWLSKVTYVSLNMDGPTFNVFIYIMRNAHNAAAVQGRAGHLHAADAQEASGEH